MVALKPCPFCGADDPELFIFDPDCAYDHWAVCTTCGASSAPGAPENATTSWNTRPPLASEEELEALASVIFDETERARVGVCSRRAAILSALERRLRGVE